MNINIQPIQKADIGDGGTLQVHSIFHTIQGEGPLTGHPAIFVRLAGCNLQCPMCDTEYTGPKVRAMSVEGIVAEVRAHHPGPRLVVITGGEPFRQNITPLCLALMDEDYQVQIETNGSLPPPPEFPSSVGQFGEFGAWVVVSPKAGKVHPKTEAIAVAYKYVLSHDSLDKEDGLPIKALDHSCGPNGVARPPEGWMPEAIYLQPADAQDIHINWKNTQAVINSCMRFGYTLQLQTHKILNLE